MGSLNSFVSTNSYMVESITFSPNSYMVMSSINKGNLILSLLIWMVFLSPSCLNCFGQDVQDYEHGSGKSGHPCLVHDLRGEASNFKLLSRRLAMGMLYVVLLC